MKNGRDENHGADERTETAGHNVSDVAEVAGDKAEEIDAGVDKEADQEDQGGLGKGDGEQVEPVDGGEVGMVEAGRDEGGGGLDLVTLMG